MPWKSPFITPWAGFRSRNQPTVFAEQGVYHAWFDGASGPINPGGTATYGVMIKDQDGTILVWEHGLVGKGSAMSNNLAEYAGVLQILKYLSTRPPGRVTIHGDSKLVI